MKGLLSLLLLSLPLYGQTPITPEMIPAGAVNPVYRATVANQPAEPYCPRTEYTLKWFVVGDWVTADDGSHWIVREGGQIRVFTGPHEHLKFEPYCVPQSIGEPAAADPLNSTYVFGSNYVSNGDALKVKPHPAQNSVEKDLGHGVTYDYVDNPDPWDGPRGVVIRPKPHDKDKPSSYRSSGTIALHTCHNNLLWCDQDGIVVEGFDPHKPQPLEQLGDSGTNDHSISGWISNWIDTTVRRYNK